MLEASNMAHIRFHDLRHSTASFLLKQGFSLKEVSVWLGHSDIQTTANIYAHIDKEQQENMAKILNKCITLEDFSYVRKRWKLKRFERLKNLSNPLGADEGTWTPTSSTLDPKWREALIIRYYVKLFFLIQTLYFHGAKVVYIIKIAESIYTHKCNAFKTMWPKCDQLLYMCFLFLNLCYN